MEVRLIAFDLDGTLLDDRKQISERTMNALKAAAQKGIVMVPATGRLRSGIPKAVLELPFVHYLITLNGAVVWDLQKEDPIYRKIFTKEQSLEIWDYTSSFDVLRDMYADGGGFIEESSMDLLETYVYYPEMIELVKATRRPIPSIREQILQAKEGVEKFNLYFVDPELQKEVKASLKERFPYLKATTSLVNNIELNNREADKGIALRELCDYLQIPVEQTMVFGDGDNDIAMLEAAGCGVAMANAEEAVKARADRVALSNQEDGVARIIEEVLGMEVKEA